MATHSSAGTQPQMAPAVIGPTIGAPPAMLEKWCPSSTGFFDGTYSCPSSYLWAGVSRESSRSTNCERYREYPTYPTENVINTAATIQITCVIVTYLRDTH
jgi:hypothetical protein